MSRDMRPCEGRRPWSLSMLVVAVVLTVAVLSPALGQISPQGPIFSLDQIVVSLSDEQSFDPGSRLYTYVYTVTSGRASKQDIWWIAVEATGRIADAAVPPGWRFDPFPKRPIIVWHGFDSELRPGQSLRFTMRSPNPPEDGWVYIQGDGPLPKGSAEMDRLQNCCPALFDFAVNSVRFRTKVPHSYTKLEINLSPGTISLFHPTDIVTVIVYGSPALNVRRVDWEDWRLGPAAGGELHRHPMFRAQRARQFVDANRDGREDVKLEFAVGSLGVRVGDRTLCLYGRTPEKEWLRGCESVVVTN